MFERFGEHSRRVVVLAQDEARLLGHSYVGTEHLLLGMLSDSDADTVAERALSAVDVTHARVRAWVDEVIGPGGGSPAGHLPFNPRAKKTLEFALREAVALSHNVMSSGHLLLGLLRDGDGIGLQALVALGVDLDGLRQRTLALLAAGANDAGSPQPATTVIDLVQELRDEIRALRAEVQELRQLIAKAPPA